MDEPEIVKVMGQRERILVIKHGALGDIVQGLDAFASLRAGCPNAHIALVTTPAFASLAAMMPWFDEVITDPRAPAFNIRQIIRMRSILRNGWDKIVDLQCSRRTAHYHRFYASSDSRWFGTANGVSDPYPDFTGVNNHRRMLTGVGMAGGRELAPDEVDFSWLRGTNSAAALPFEGLRGRPFATLIPGCSAAKPQKKWPAERFVALANALHLAGMEIAIVGTKTDRPDA
ncbi:MAG: glycosyltransferase family 9 protein, partial [Alphaproteobacteria bacterium]